MTPTPSKAIPTFYRGCRFRSRLEARWAVFFDRIGVEWRYEPQGYFLKQRPYLPDFFIPKWEMFVEIKPHLLREDSIELCTQLAAETSRTVMLLQGDPYPGEHRITLDSINDQTGASYEFGTCRRCDAIWLVGVGEFEGFAGAVEKCDCKGDRLPLTGDWAKRTYAALIAARSARFEHGENPQ